LKQVWVALALVLFLGAKDNYVFDFKGDELLQDKIELLEREVAALQTQLNSLKNDAEIAMKNSGSAIKRLQTDIAKLQKTPQPKTVTPAPPSSTQVIAVELPIAEMNERVTKLEADIVALQKSVTAASQPPQTPMTIKNDFATQAQFNQMSERSNKLEADVKEIKERLQEDSGLPFDQYLEITKAHIEYFILGLLTFIVLSFLMLLAALGKASRADSKISQLIKLYQSSSKKIDDRK
jgi:peptidoglycan hydrolase CwlO-like protein